MTDLEALFLILAAVYLSQCLSWVAPHAYVFSRNFRGQWISGAPEIALRAWKVKAAIANPLPFFAGVVVAEPEPPAVTAEGILPSPIANSSDGEGSEERRVLLWKEVRKFSAKGERVLADGRPIHRCVSSAEARRWATWLTALAKHPASRSHAIEKELKRQFDSKAIRAKTGEFQAATGWIGTLANLLFFVLPVVVPAYIWAGVRAVTWVALLLVTLLLIAATTRSYLSAHRKLYPDEKDARFSETLTVALSPFAAMRAHDSLGRNLLASFDPLAIAAVLLPAPAFEQVAGQAYRNMLFPLACSEPGSEAFQLESRGFQQMRDRVRLAFLKKNVADLERFAAAPPADSPESCAYCPRCHAQFRIASGTCNDCGGIALLPLPQADASRPS